ncbi:MAG: hypothetical protein JWM19_5241 [Actinomycetia bacterium]|nr:hypothetical protein [Actinomycetes bacterium]
MINHTMLVAFTNTISDEDLARFMTDIEKPMRATGLVKSFTARRHIAIPGEEAIPAFIATAVLQFGVADVEALGALFSAPGIDEVIDTWQEDHPYKVAWVNHDALP